MAQIDLLAVLTETLTLVRNQARIQKIKLRSHLPKEPILISGVVSLLQQAFLNLLLNAIDAMPDGGSLSVSLRKVARQALICIKDTGRGISDKELEKIFDPFYTTSPVGKGTGLGLSITYSVVKQHFGSIEVESDVGKGSTFTLRLPVL